ncbi:class I SAM-dependent methyltransferase [Micromonospora sp. WMMD1082]|uniref:class I SAM-dependent methyltransferase n=1 Tax=Micromonospora sp. WMMD1082 TaxID=3016104 RepID=UPI0024173CB5|nr:class I SAM-dependent methyltransferase [Micromonospora sp. WMMD1082]MDG4798775.1 class I SAM-dependent methyltransferase [Micromonospora sp. WMMD1082]
MDWVRSFYSQTGAWWGAAEAKISDRDHRRVRLLHEHRGTRPIRVLELGCGYGTTAAAMAAAGHVVTAVEISDRARHAVDFARAAAPGRLSIVQDDFYAVQLPERFDAVCYWNGFGVGTDADQRRLLVRIARDWLKPDGVALVDVQNPFGWARWDGDEEHRLPNPELGYAHELYERTTFDPVTCTATDTWWEAASPHHKISQTLRCYSPADLALLLAGTGLTLTAVTVGDRPVDPTTPLPSFSGLLHEHHEYLAVLHHDLRGC